MNAADTAMEHVEQIDVAGAPAAGWRRFVTARTIGWATFIVVLLAAALSTTVVHVDDAEPAHAFSATEYAAEKFPTVIEPAIIKSAVEFPELFAAFAADEDAAKLEFGNSSNPHNAYSYPVTFTATAGVPDGATIPLTVEGVPADVDVTMQLFDLRGTALRDVTGTVDLNDFLNQVEYLQVALELNSHIKAEVIDPFLAEHPAETLEGTQLQITGVFTRDTKTAISVVPLKIEVVS